MNPRRHRLLAILILCLWMSPSLGALGMGVHMILDHHDDGIEHSHSASDWAEWMAHGHRHGAEATPDHDHAVIVEGTTPWVRSTLGSMAVQPLASLPGVQPSKPPVAADFDRPSPTTPLFRTHCSLLI